MFFSWLGNIRQNVCIALATLTRLLPGVLLGEVHMTGGMLIHEISVLIVILNGMRLMRLKGEKAGKGRLAPATRPIDLPAGSVDNKETGGTA